MPGVTCEITYNRQMISSLSATAVFDDCRALRAHAATGVGVTTSGLGGWPGGFRETRPPDLMILRVAVHDAIALGSLLKGTPSLAEIAENIPLLAEYFIKKYDWMRLVTGISPKAQEILMRYSWPGNVRELENVIPRAFILGKSNLIQPEDLSGDIRNAIRTRPP